MSRLNKASIKRIHEGLEKSVFTTGDFEVSFPESGQALASIKFLPTKGYSLLIAQYGTAGDEKFYTRETPGEHKSIEDHDQSGFESCLSRIPEWCKHIRADLRASNPVFDEFEEFRRTLEAQIREHVENPEQHFSREEADALRAKLDEILAKFDDLSNRNAITEAEIKLVREEIAELKKDVGTFPKGAFFKTSGNKLLRLMKRFSKSDVAKELIITTTKHFLELPKS